MKRRVLLSTVCLIAIAAVFVTCRRAPKETEELKVSGAIEVTSVEVSFKVPGRLKQRLADEGELVRSGQVVALLEDDELKEERGSRAADLRAARAAHARDAARMEALFRREVIPLKDLDAARSGRDASAAVVRETEERLKLLRIGPRPDAVRQARARSEAAGSALTLAETRLSQSVLYAPQAGVVLAKHAEPGEMLAPGAPVITVGKLDEVWLRGYIPESELGRVKVGQPARVTTDTWPGRVYDGRISFISSEAEFTPKNVQTEKERVKLVYRIKITLPNPKMELKPGMPADAVIETNERPAGR